MNSADSSTSSGTRANEAAAEPQEVVEAGTEKHSFSANRAAKPRDAASLMVSCSEAAEELKASRKLIAALESENTALLERLETEKRAVSLLIDLNETRRAENEALRSAAAAKGEVVAAKDEVIAGQERVIEALKKKKSSPWKRVGDVLVGIAAGVLLR